LDKYFDSWVETDASDRLAPGEAIRDSETLPPKKGLDCNDRRSDVQSPIQGHGIKQVYKLYRKRRESSFKRVSNPQGKYDK